MSEKERNAVVGNYSCDVTRGAPLARVRCGRTHRGGFLSHDDRRILDARKSRNVTSHNSIHTQTPMCKTVDISAARVPGSRAVQTAGPGATSHVLAISMRDRSTLAVLSHPL